MYLWKQVENPKQPSFNGAVSQLVTFRQFLEPDFKRWACGEIGWQFGFNRKLWEYSYILRALEVHGLLGGCGLGFGVGQEPIVPVLLRHGASLVVSDLADEDAQAKGWQRMQFDVSSTSTLSFRFIDMNIIPTDLRGFDFVWSCGSLEHIGGLENGLRFVENAMRCLRPGGLAVHTTELTLTPDSGRYDTPGLSLYSDKDIKDLAKRLGAAGHILELNLSRGDHQLDRLVLEEASPWEMSLKECISDHLITSIGLIIQRAD